MSRQCQCGGVIRQHQLTDGREVWTCNECERRTERRLSLHPARQGGWMDTQTTPVAEVQLATDCEADE